MDIRTLPIGKIKAAKYNPRKDLQPTDSEYIKLRRSIETFGYCDPLIVNQRTGNLVGGHQRLKVLKDLGYTEVEVSMVDLDDDQEKALNIALNKIEGGWEFSTLADLLLDLDSSNYDLTLTGFDADEVQRMMAWTPGVDATKEAPEEFKEIDESTTCQCPKCGYRYNG